MSEDKLENLIFNLIHQGIKLENLINKTCVVDTIVMKLKILLKSLTIIY